MEELTLAQKVQKAHDDDLAMQEMIFEAERVARAQSPSLAVQAERLATALWEDTADDAMYFLSSVRRDMRTPFTAQTDIPIGMYL